jgi:hypothetical protein
MSHRADEKERRRQERLAAEEAAKKNADRRKRLGLVGAVALVAAVAVFVVFAVAGGGDDGDGGAGSGETGASASVPAQKIDNLAEAARAAQCEVTEHKIEGRGHTSETVKYKTNPPTSGDHDPTAAEDGAYAADGAPDVEQSVHSLEHGRINLQYKAGTPEDRIAQLETVADEEVKGTAGYHTLVFQNQTKMEPAVAATAWGRSLTCATWNDQIFDAIRAFRRDRVDKGPEFIP